MTKMADPTARTTVLGGSQVPTTRSVRILAACGWRQVFYEESTWTRVRCYWGLVHQLMAECSRTGTRRVINPRNRARTPNQKGKAQRVVLLHFATCHRPLVTD